ncbi:ribokinase [Streptoalloteichus tenebrarius]|uniref:Ribokinase n=1 Tax=Streptoalloteichus tenebrarius (strain ATCC 17920 / DSM 40477 / JCM 4838 / CBS 697.72 / NBRC 16177 / NCIMB 11028 / NRRL B-12390 / A12253. 1 / ISP 5477) TaxID=1933 RepID=A0ABT1HWL0_STRSD|nr:ribokinase [Streptoalloteichus tenebrarius]MCP2259906.1 ribokinase [Streptoalloteichus tenebrarius]BFF03231.1 ribokinase [Streptoalloteichus tenebrarius]
MAPSITVVGSVNLDLLAGVRALPRPGETLTATRFDRAPGGKGANQALAARRLGAEVSLVGAVGADASAEPALALLREAGVDLTHVSTVDDATGTALIEVDESADTTIVVVPGANAHVTVHPGQLAGADAVLTVLEVPERAVVAAAEHAPNFFALNAAPARPVPQAVLDRADLVVVNREEYEGVPGVDRVRTVAVTLGAEGAVLLREGREVARATPPTVRAVDGTAAGDAFTAALVLGLLEGREDEEALRRACAVGALTATRHGAQPSLPTLAEVEEVLAR